MPSLHEILGWSELAGITIALVFTFPLRNQPGYLKPVRIYIWGAFLLIIGITIIHKFKIPWNFPKEWRSNNFLYNAQSTLRLICFSLFFIKLNQPFFRSSKKVILVLFIVFFLVNFIFLEDFFYYSYLSGRLHSVETSILLLLCLLYYFYILTEEKSRTRNSPAFWVTTGLCIYVVVNFPIYLFYRAAVHQYRKFTVNIWDVQNVSFVIFCICLARAFTLARRQNLAHSKNPQHA